MKYGAWLALIVLGTLAGWTPAQAGEEQEEVPEDVAAACAAVAEGIAFFSGYIAGIPFGDIGKALSVHIATKYGPEAIDKKCKDYYRSLEEQKDSFDYNRFVREVCGGNPLTCPNGWNPLGNLPSSPFDCYMYTVCNLSLAVRSDNSVSVQDLLNAGAFIDLSRRAGYWDYANFGYLVGIEGLSPSLDVR